MMIKTISGEVLKLFCGRTPLSSERIARSESIYPASRIEVDERRKIRFELRGSSKLVWSRGCGVSSARVLTWGLGLLWAILSPAGRAIAQQASTSVAPLFSTNSKYVQGVGPGYWPTAGTGLTLNIAAGTAMCGSPPVLVSYVGGTLAMTASQTNYVFLDPSSNCTPNFNSTGFTFGQIPLAKVTTSASAITATTDARTWFVSQPVGTDSAGRATLNGGLNSAVTDFTSQNITTFPGTGFIPWWFQTTNTLPAIGVWPNYQTIGCGLSALDGGVNVYTLNPVFSNKTTYSCLNASQVGYTPGQKYGLFSADYNYSVGDTAAAVLASYGWGGLVSEGDQGINPLYVTAQQMSTVYAGTIASGGSTGSTSLTITTTANSGTQGAGRYLIDTLAGKIINAGTISAISAPAGSTPPTYTLAGSTWTQSSVQALLGTAITAPPGSVTVTPNTFTLGTIATLSVGVKVCVADPDSFEMVTVTAQAGATFTAVFRKPHRAATVIMAGGMCGYGIELLADRVPSTNPVARWLWPVIGAPTTTTVLVWLPTQNGGYDSYFGQWSATGTNTYAAYPMAEVTSVQSGGALSNTLTLAPNNAAWSNADTVELQIYPTTEVNAMNATSVKNFPSSSLLGSQILRFNLTGLWLGKDQAILGANNTPASAYNVAGGTGQQGPPNYTLLSGPFTDYLYGYAPSNAVLDFSTCSALNVVACNAAPDYSLLRFLAKNGSFSINVSPANNAVYFSSHLGSSNTDTQGSVTLTAATSVALPTFTTAYTNAPRVLLQATTDTTACGAVWITKNAPSTTIVTINVKTACTATWDYFVFANVN